MPGGLLPRRPALPVLILALAALSAAWTGALAQTEPRFQLGFQLLADQIPEVVGDPLEDEWHNPENGDGLQQTTIGLMVWRKADNWTAFTDGHRTWINGPSGVQSRLNGQRFDWESTVPSTMPAATPQPPEDLYVDPRVLAKDPGAFLGRKVTVQGRSESVGHYSTPRSHTRVWLDALVRDGPGLNEEILIYIHPGTPGVLKEECFRFTGVVKDVGELRPVIEADSWSSVGRTSGGACVAP